MKKRSFLPDKAEYPAHKPSTSAPPSSKTQQKQTSDDWKIWGPSTRNWASEVISWAKRLSSTTLKTCPLASLLPFLLHLQPLSHSASFYPSASICQLFPVRDWGMSHSRGVQRVRISAAALPCTPAHVLSLTDGCGRGRERTKAMTGEAGQLLLQTEAPVISQQVSVNAVKNNNVTQRNTEQREERKQRKPRQYAKTWTQTKGEIWNPTIGSPMISNSQRH